LLLDVRWVARAAEHENGSSGTVDGLTRSANSRNLNGSGETTSQLLLLLLLVGHGRLLLLQNLLLLCYNCFRLARRHSHGSGRNWNVSAERYNLSTTGQLLLLLLLLSEGL
jgi:hypothetical protein